MCSTTTAEAARKPPAIRKKTATSPPPSRSTRPSSASRSPFVFFSLDLQRELFRYLSCASESSVAATVLEENDDYRYPTKTADPLSPKRSDASTTQTSESSSCSFEDNINNNYDEGNHVRHDHRTRPQERDDVKGSNNSEQPLSVSRSTSHDESTVMVMYFDKKGRLRSTDERHTIGETSSTDDTVPSVESSDSFFSSSPRNRSRDQKRCKLLQRLKHQQEQRRTQEFLHENQSKIQEMAQDQQQEEDDYSSLSTSSSSHQRRRRRKKQQEIMAVSEFAGFAPRASHKKKEKPKLNLTLFRKKTSGATKNEVSDNKSLSGHSIRSKTSRGSIRSRNSRSSIKSRKSTKITVRTVEPQPVSILRRTNSMPDISSSTKQMSEPSASGVRFAEGTVFVEPKTRKKVPRLNPNASRRRRPQRSSLANHRRRSLLVSETAVRAGRNNNNNPEDAKSAAELESALSALTLQESYYPDVQCNPVEDLVPLLAVASSMDCYVFR